MTITKIILTVMLLLGISGYNSDLQFYPQDFTVINVDKTADVVQIEEFNGYVYEFNGTEDWQIGDKCACIMCNNGTGDITDDLIISTKYCGYEK